MSKQNKETKERKDNSSALHEFVKCAYCAAKILKGVYPKYIDNPVECNAVCEQCHEEELKDSGICEHCNGTGVDTMGLFPCQICFGEGTSI